MIAAFLDRDRADKWLSGMEEQGYVVETKVSPSGETVYMLHKPADPVRTPPVTEVAS